MSNQTFKTSLVLATALFLLWTLVTIVLWPVEDYADAMLAYTESTNQIVRAMSIGITAYVASLALLFGFARKPEEIGFQPKLH